jgi:hypothetical protein
MKIRFHIPFAVLATIWFFMLPLMVIVRSKLIQSTAPRAFFQYWLT